MEETTLCGVRTVVVYGPSGPQKQTRTVHCPAGNGTMSLEQCEHCAHRVKTVAAAHVSRSHLACRVGGDFLARATMVSEIMPRMVVAVRPDLHLDAMLLTLIEHDHGGAPVVDHEGRPIGMVSVTDLLLEYRARRLAAEVPGAPTRLRLVADVMTRGAFTIPEDACVDEAMDELVRRNVKRLAVVGDGGELVGIVTALDLLRAYPPLPVRSGPAVAERLSA